MDDLVLETKLFPPLLPSRLVHRQRLIDKLNASQDVRFTLVSAPAGFGKTTAVIQWLHETRVNVAWLTLETHDSRFSVFARLLLTALQRVNPEIGCVAKSMVEQDLHLSAMSLATTILNDIEVFAQPIVIVLDDYHVIENQVIHNFVDRLIEYAPRFLRVILISRADPPLRLAHFRAHDQMNEIRISDLCFNEKETAQLLIKEMKLELVRDDIRTLQRRTEGWIVGLQLVSYSLKSMPASDRPSAIAAFSGDNRFIVDYLLDEVLLLQRPHIQDFLLQTSILSSLNASLCDAVTRRKDSSTILRYLTQTNVFVESVRTDQATLRYHPLFAEMLQCRLCETYPEIVPHLHRRANEWYHRRGSDIEAVRHALAAGDLNLAEPQTQEVNVSSLWEANDLTAAMLWLGKLPLEAFYHRPALWLCRLRHLIWTGDVDTIQFQLEQLEGLSSSGMDIALPGQTKALHALLCHCDGDLVQSRHYAQDAMLDLSQKDTLTHLTCNYILANSHVMVGEFEVASRIFSEMGRYGHQTNSATAIVLGLGSLGRLAMYEGDARGAYNIFKLVDGMIENLELSDFELPQLKGLMLLSMGELFYEQNMIDVAYEYLETGIQHCQKTPLFVPYVVDATTTLARLYACQRNQRLRAQNLVNNMMDWVKRLAVTEQNLNKLMACEVYLSLKNSYGDLESAHKWTVDGGLLPDDPVSFAWEYQYLVLARVLMAQGQNADAIHLLGNVEQLAIDQGRMASVLDCVVLKSLAWQALNEMEKALMSIDRALRLAAPMGYIRVFVDEGPSMASLLMKYDQVMSAEYNPFYDRLIDAFPGDISSIRHIRRAHEVYEADPLTAREAEVLELLVGEYTAQGIADKLFVSIHTARTHIKNIYRKLGVGSRYEAIIRAKELELIST